MAKALNFRKFRKVVSDDLDTLRAEMNEIRSELTTARDQLIATNATNESVALSISAIDSRVVHLGRELTNQLHELSSDLEQLEKQNDGASAETIAHLQTTQIRLATEQARYEIAFRQDLAEIADQLRRQR